MANTWKSALGLNFYVLGSGTPAAFPVSATPPYVQLLASQINTLASSGQTIIAFRATGQMTPPADQVGRQFGFNWQNTAGFNQSATLVSGVNTMVVNPVLISSVAPVLFYAMPSTGEPYTINITQMDFLVQDNTSTTDSTGTPEMVLSWSDDGGHNFANRQVQSMGNTGQTAQRVIFRRIGSTRRNSGLDRILEISSDAAMQVALVGASIGDD